METPQEIKDAAERRMKLTRYAIMWRRKELGLSQVELGKRIGIDRFSIHKLESGKRPIYMSELCEIAYVLGCDPVDLMRGEVG